MFAELSRDFIAQLNSVAFENVVVTPTMMDGSKVRTLLGIREVKGDEPKHFSHKGVNYWMNNNSTNRPLNMDNARFLQTMIESGHYVYNGETWIVDDRGQIGSCAHRGVGLFLATLTDPTIKIPILLVTNVPHQFIDTLDTGRSRSNTDVLARNSEDFFPIDMLENISGEGFGPVATEVRKSLCKELGSGVRLFTYRENGKDISANGKFRQAELFSTLKRCQDFQKLVLTVYNYDRGVSGKASFSQIWGVAQVATVLLLASNVDKTPHCDTLSVNWDIVDMVCKSLADMSPESPVASAYKDLNPYTKRGTGKRLARQHKFAALVSTVQQLIESDRTTERVIPTDKQMKDKKYPHFGGVDQGYVAPTRGKKSDEESDDTEE